MAYMNALEILKELLKLDDLGSRQIKELIQSIKTDSFFSKRAAILDSSKTENLLINEITKYYMSNRSGSDEKTFYNNLYRLSKGVIDGFRPDVISLINNIDNITDEKTRYDLLKRLYRVSKERSIRDSVWLFFLENPNIKIEDFFRFFAKWHAGEIEVSKGSFSKIKRHFALALAKFFASANDVSSDFFDSRIYEINKALNLIRDNDVNFVAGIRKKYNIENVASHKKPDAKTKEDTTQSKDKKIFDLYKRLEEKDLEIKSLEDKLHEKDIYIQSLINMMEKGK